MTALSLGSWLLLAGAGAAAAIVGLVVIRLAWRARGIYLIRRAGPRRLRAAAHLLWREPGKVEALDLTHGPGSAAMEPRAPFRFVEEHLTGSQPCVSVTDARGRVWRVKWGMEVRAENFAVRLVHACGYFSEVTYRELHRRRLHVCRGAIRARRSRCAETVRGAQLGVE
jgi:hypothetical protein